MHTSSSGDSGSRAEPATGSAAHERPSALERIREPIRGWAVGQGRAAEWSLYFLTASGALLWLDAALPWWITRHVLWVHIAAGLVLFPAIVLPFWLAHRAAKRDTLVARMRVTGRAIEAMLLLVFASGVYLVCVGNPGEVLGRSAYWIHLLGSLPLLLALLVHVARRGAAARAMSVMLAHARPTRD
jgi:hypothetical protein